MTSQTPDTTTSPFGELEELGNVDDKVRRQRAGYISIITLNRPDRLNAIDADTHLLLRQALAEADHDPLSRVIVITGSGRGFCAGGDVSGMGGEFFKTERKQVRSPGRMMQHALVNLEKPLIAMVNGVAAGLGATIALSADIVYMAESARIGDTHVQMGLVAGDGGATHWPLLIGTARAKEMLMTGRLLDAKTAAEIGLVSQVHPDDALADAVAEVANELAALPPYAVQATKVSVNRLIEVAMGIAHDVSSSYEHASMETTDHKEAIAAFREKRPGNYIGR